MRRMRRRGDDSRYRRFARAKNVATKSPVGVCAIIIRGNVLPSRYARMQMLKKLDVNKATLANIFLETKALREFLADPVFTDERGFSDLASDVIDEVYGKPVKSDFANISAMCWFYTPKQNVLLKLLQDRGIISKKQGYREPVRTSSFKEWSKQHP